ncbi:MAG: glycosyltransferase family 2 protein [Ardenticatenaceae bacterium]|nr:glycosyltransferase family 2 protein [Ardenticatenaceae bacterium]MCB8989843.1 glycosyltransferase family 2 protein [Ardenticatenaceae bacterium]
MKALQNIGKVGVVIPAFNEEKGLGRVLEVVSAIDWITEFVVVDDGSTDSTLTVAQVWAQQDGRITPIRLPHNVGKGGAMLAGAQALSTDLVLFLDADLIGLRPYHLQSICLPVLANAADMSVAVFRQGDIRTDAALLLTPYLSGQRCLRWQAALQALSRMANTRYGVEVALTDYAKQHHWRNQYVNWYDLTHTVKEAKRGRLAGWQSRWRQFAKCQPNNRRNQRDSSPARCWLGNCCQQRSRQFGHGLLRRTCGFTANITAKRTGCTH